MSQGEVEGRKPSAVEIAKAASHQLRGTIAEELANDMDMFEHDAVNLLKNHGTYQQDDRDSRGQKSADGAKTKSYQFMVRTRIPGGRIPAAALLRELDLCDEYANGTLRITTRQGLQLHGVIKTNLKATIRAINEAQLTTLAACGDVQRNVMCCPAPFNKNPIRREIQEMCSRIAEHFKPRTLAYHEIWLKDSEGNECQVAPTIVEEPIYGNTYLPRKFKTAIALPEDNCVDVYTNDLGFLVVAEGDRIVGYNVLVGGGMGVTPSAKKTFPALAKQMAFVTPDQVIPVAEAVVKVQRDFGNRSDRKQARLKYLIHNWGLDQFKLKVEEYLGYPLPAPRNIDVHDVDDHLGWHDQGDGRWFLGINIMNGRIKDEGTLRIKTGLRALLKRFPHECRLTPLQSLILCDVSPSDRAEVDQILSAHGIAPIEQWSLLARYGIACPAWPTCGLSITEAERVFPDVLEELGVEIARLGLSHERISVHMTGCPNGCARPYTPDIGFVGKAAGERYTIYLGGNSIGTRLGFIFADMVERSQLLPTLAPVLSRFKSERQGTESFGDFCARLGKENLEGIPV